MTIILTHSCFRNLKHYNPTIKEQAVINHEREDKLGRITRKKRKRNVVDDEGGDSRGELEQNRNDKSTKYQKISSYNQNSSHNDREQKATNHLGGHERQFLSNALLRDNVFRPPYDYSSLEMGETGFHNEHQRMPTLSWERNVIFLRNRTTNLSPKFVAKWSAKRVAYFVSSLPGLCYNHDIGSRNGVFSSDGIYLSL